MILLLPHWIRQRHHTTAVKLFSAYTENQDDLPPTIFFVWGSVLSCCWPLAIQALGGTGQEHPLLAAPGCPKVAHWEILHKRHCRMRHFPPKFDRPLILSILWQVPDQYRNLLPLKLRVIVFDNSARIYGVNPMDARPSRYLLLKPQLFVPYFLHKRWCGRFCL